jgi:general secretion pathway protein I
VNGRRHAPAGRGGFTLLEVMVSLAILAGALLLVSDIVTGALRNHVRARNLEIATLLARAKLAEVEDHYEAEGFKTSDESDDGSFEEEGHPEITWKLAVTAPAVELGPDAVLALLTGSQGGLQDLVPPEQAPLLAPFMATLPALATKVGEQLKRGVREVALTVSWPENGLEEHFTVRTHMVVLSPGQVVPP